MTSLLITIPLTVCLLFTSAVAQELYRWVDERGVVHFTDNPLSVPEKYRDKAERRRFPSEFSPQIDLPQVAPEEPIPSSEGEKIVVPFTRERGHIVVEGIVNERGAVKFYLDTGADGSSIPKDVAKGVGIDVDKGILISVGGVSGTVLVPQVEIETVKVGDAVVRNLDVTIMDLAGGKVRKETGLLGADFLVEYNVNIDYDKNQVILVPKPRPYGGHSLEWWKRRFNFYHRLRKRYEAAVTELRKNMERQREPKRVFSEDQDSFTNRQLKEAERMEDSLRRIEEKLSDLEVKASQIGLPREFRQ